MPKFRLQSLTGGLALAGLLAACAPGSAQAPGGADAAPVVVADVTVQEPVATSAPVPQDGPSLPEDPAEALKATLESKDYASLEAQMVPNFAFGLIASEGLTYTPTEFVEQLQSTYLGPGDVRVDLGLDVRGEVSPDYVSLVDGYARTLYSTGWGETQADTALLFLNEQGQWAGMLYMFEGLEELFLFTGEVAGQQAAEASETEESTPTFDVDNRALGPFQDTLLEGITVKRNYSMLQSLMGDPFVIGYWESEGIERSPQAAAEILRNDLLPPEAFVSYTLTGDLSALLYGQNPLTMWGPGVSAVRAIHSTGWGPDGKAEAILIIAQRPDGTYYWHSILYAPRGFAQT